MPDPRAAILESSAESLSCFSADMTGSEVTGATLDMGTGSNEAGMMAQLRALS
jgi:hypothetical protein